MATWPLKKEARVAGIDDGRYEKGSEQTPVVMTVYRLDGRIEGLLKGSITTDGDDSSRVIAEMLNESRFMDQVRCIISDGACLGGFNVLDMDDLFGRTSLPVITASDERPDTPSIMEALKENFGDWRRRLGIIESHEPCPIELPDGICYIRVKGISKEFASDTVRRATLQGRTPEPVRISHIVASLL
ncbi:MAG: DUF99 family protein [Thermoplasmatota archaeon]